MDTVAAIEARLRELLSRIPDAHMRVSLKREIDALLEMARKA